MRKEKMLTTKEVAEKIGVKYPTVMLWIRENKLAGAVKETSPRGDYWLVPESSLAGIVKRGQGRPKKATDETEPPEAPAITAVEIKAGDVVKTKATKKRASKKGN